MATNDPEVLWREFSTEFIQEIINTSTRRAGRSWRTSAVHECSPETLNGLLWVALTFSGSLHGGCVLGLSVEEAGIVAADIQSEGTTGVAEILAESFTAISANLCAAAREPYGQFNFVASEGAPGGGDGKLSLALDLQNERGQSIRIVNCGSPELIGSLALIAAGEKGDVPNVSSETEAPLVASLFGDAPNLDLLMDIELDVTLRFGQRHLTLREVMDLTSGSVVELDRQIEEPVELMLDGKVIARGEAVVIDGNYGLRVTDVPHPLTARQVRL